MSNTAFGTLPPLGVPPIIQSGGTSQPPILFDDEPNPLKIKMGPLGQIALPLAGVKAKPPKAPGPGKGNGKKAKLALLASRPPDGDGNGDPPKPNVAGLNSAVEPSSVTTNLKGSSAPTPKKKANKPASSKKKGASVAPGSTPQISTIVMASA